MVSKKYFLITESKRVDLSGWGRQYGVVEKIFFDSKTPTEHSSSGILICSKRGESKVPLHYHNCETFHYVIYGNGIIRDAEGNVHELNPGVAFYCGPGPKGAHSFENTDDLPLAILWVHAYPKGIREETVWIEEVD